MSLVPIFDGHNDALLRLHMAGGDPGPFVEGRDKGHVDLPKARTGGLAGGFFAVFVPAPKPEGEEVVDGADDPDAVPRLEGLGRPLSHAQALVETNFMIDLLFELESRSEGRLEVVRDAAAIRNCVDRGVVAALLHLEGAEAVPATLDNLEALYERGVRSIGPVWSRINDFAHGVPFAFPSHPDVGPGLSDAGRDLVAECARLRILVDCAHLNERGFWDVAEMATQPLVVTHTAVHALANKARNLTDAQIDAVGETQGVIGLNFHVADLRADGKWKSDTPVSRLVEHIDHLVDRIGVERVAFGSDYDGALPPAALSDASKLPRLIGELEQRGYSAEDVRRLACDNWIDLLSRVIG